MSLNKIRKRAIARVKRRSEMAEQELLSGYTAKQITEAMRSLGCIVQAVSDGLVAFGKALSDSMKKQSEERT